MCCGLPIAVYLTAQWVRTVTRSLQVSEQLYVFKICLHISCFFINSLVLLLAKSSRRHDEDKL